MKFQKLTLLLGILLVSNIAIASNEVPEPFEPPPIFGSTPPTAHWIWYVIAGQKDRSAPVVYISTKHFKTRWPEVLIVLPQVKYDVIAKFTLSRLSASSCPFEVQKPLPPYAVQIFEHRGGKTSSCMISQASACDYIAKVMHLPAMNWSPAQLKILDEFAGGDQCKSILDPPR